MNERSQRSETPKAGRMHPRGWSGTAFVGSILFLLVCWISTPCFPVETGAKSGADPYSRGVVLLTEQKWKQAAAEFQQAIRSDPKNSQAYGGLGVALTR